MLLQIYCLSKPPNQDILFLLTGLESVGKMVKYDLVKIQISEQIHQNSAFIHLTAREIRNMSYVRQYPPHSISHHHVFILYFKFLCLCFSRLEKLSLCPIRQTQLAAFRLFHCSNTKTTFMKTSQSPNKAFHSNLFRDFI